MKRFRVRAAEKAEKFDCDPVDRMDDNPNAKKPFATFLTKENGADPPNAALSVYEPGKANNTLVVVKITNPVVDGADLIYSYKIIQGTMPASGGATSLFIDWIGVGARGPGAL
jgi:hypothetical protein